MEDLVARVRPHLAELSKFVVVGGFCFVLDFVLSDALHFGAGLGPTISKVISTVVATAVSYVGNRLWSFAAHVQDDADQRRDVLVYTLINIAGLLITLVPVDVTHYLLDLTGPIAFNVSQVLGTLVATVFRFWSYKRWVFVPATVTPLPVELDQPLDQPAARRQAS